MFEFDSMINLDKQNKNFEELGKQLRQKIDAEILMVTRGEEGVTLFTDNNVQWKSSAKIKDGTYKIGIRPHNITTYKEGNNSVEINGKVQISELSGSESLIHFTNGNLNWVSLSNGTQQKNVGEDTKLYMNTDEFLYFDQNNRLVNNG